MENAFASIVRSGEAGVWNAVTALPRPDIAHLVLRYHGYSAPASMGFADRMAADLFYPVIINFGAPWRIGAKAVDRAFDSFVAGPTDRATDVSSTGNPSCLQVDLTPFGARALLQFPLHELGHQIVDLGDVLGVTPELRAHLAATDDWTERLLILDCLIRARLQGFEVDPLAAAAWQTLTARQGRVRIADLAADLDCSREHLSRRFRESIGLSPKVIARIMRFRHACAMAPLTGFDWMSVALDCGYADQAHFINEFSQMAGISPGAFSRSHFSNTDTPDPARMG